MIWNYAYTPSIWPPFATALFLLILAGYSWRRRTVAGAKPFLVSCLFASLAATGLLMTDLAVDPGTKIFWFRFQAACLILGITAATCFLLDFTWPGRWLTRRNIVLIFIFPFFDVIYILFLTSGPFSLAPVDFVVGKSVTLSYNLFGRALIGYLALLALVNLIALSWLFIRSPQLRWVVVLIAASQVATRIVILKDQPSLGAQVFDIPIFVLPYLPYAIALFGLRIFDPVPLARQMAIDQMLTGVLVLDSQERVASLNLAAEQILGITSSHARGRAVREILPACVDGLQEALPGTKVEFELGSGIELRSYSLACSLLKDFRGLEVGHLLLLDDVTEQKRAQAQILEQQRVMATQNERERMARELHDSLGQVLSYTSFQVETAAKLSRDGQGTTAAEQLDRLGSVVREAHADLREVILNLHSTASLQQPFFTVVKQYLDAFTSSYDIQTLIRVDPGLDEGSLTPETQLKIFRILQEALSNARKHGRARQVQAIFSSDGDSLCMSIQDDGCGFDPDQAAKSGGPHYGLQFMRDRAEQLEGRLVVASEPGKGTRVLLDIPVKEDAERGREGDTGRGSDGK